MKNLRFLLPFFAILLSNLCANSQDGIGRSLNTPSNIEYLDNSTFIVKQGFYTRRLGVSPSTKFFKINFGLDEFGRICLLFEDFRVFGNQADILIGNNPNLIGGGTKYLMKNNSFIDSSATPIPLIVFDNLTKKFKKSAFNYLNSYFLSRSTFESLFVNGDLTINIGIAPIATNSINKMLYLVFNKDNSNNMGSTFYKKVIQPDRFSLPFIDITPGGQGGSRPCPPFGCND